MTPLSSVDSHLYFHIVGKLAERMLKLSEINDLAPRHIVRNALLAYISRCEDAAVASLPLNSSKVRSYENEYPLD